MAKWPLTQPCLLSMHQQLQHTNHMYQLQRLQAIT
jgi:hypothetical protein